MNDASRRLKIMTALAVIIFITAADRLLKQAALAGLDVTVISGLFRFHFAENRYIAFSLPFGGPPLVILVFILLALVLHYGRSAFRQGGREAALYGAIFMGGASNLYDRLVYGYVIDYLDLRYFTVFNLADVLIVGGTVLLAVITIKIKRYEK